MITNYLSINIKHTNPSLTTKKQPLLNNKKTHNFTLLIKLISLTPRGKWFFHLKLLLIK